MREDYQEKSEPPTKKKIKEARDKGYVFKSHDTTVSGMLLVNMCIFLFCSRYMYYKMRWLFQAMLTRLDYNFAHPEVANYWLQEGISYILTMMSPLYVFTFIGALAINLLQVGFVFSLTPITPKFSRINIFNGENYHKYFDFRIILKILLGQLRIIAVTISSVWLIGGDLFSIYRLTTSGSYQVMYYIYMKTMQVGFFLAISYLLIGFIELAYNRYRYYKDLMMTPREVREELRRSEGNLEIKSQIYSFMKRFISKPMHADLSQATAIITSNTHGIAVALMYIPETMEAPLCLTKGIMRKSRDILYQAELHAIPIIEDATVSKHLYGLLRVGQFVPHTLYHEVAGILALAEKKKKMLHSKTKASLQDNPTHA